MNGPTSTASYTVSNFDGMKLHTVRHGKLVVWGTSPEGIAPMRWTAKLGGAVVQTTDAGELRQAFPLRGPAVVKVIRALEAGRI